MKKHYNTPAIEFAQLIHLSVIATSDTVETDLGGKTDQLDAKSRKEPIWDD